MARMGWRRLLNLGAAAAIAVISVGVQPAPAAIPTNNTLFAVRDAFRIVTVDPRTGAETVVADLSGVPTSPGPLFTADRDPNIYGLGTTCICGGKGGAILTQVVTLDTVTGQVHITPNMALTVFGGIAFDQSTKNLYGLTLFQATCCNSALERIDPATGTETPVAQVPFRSPYVDALTIDSNTGTLYLTYGSAPFAGSAGPRAILSINLNTGAIITSPDLAEELTSLFFDTKTSALYAVTASQKLVLVDPATGQETLVASFAAGVLVHDPVLEPKSHTLLAVANGSPSRLISVDIRNGAMTFGPSLTGTITSLAIQRLRGDGDPH